MPDQNLRNKISSLGFGCMSLTGEQDLTNSLIHKAIDHGITFFDTADMYNGGKNEQWLGKALKGKREQIVLATKVGHVWDEHSYEWAPSYERVIGGCEDSLRRLQTDHIDLYQLHGGTLEDPIDDLIEAMEELKSAGKIREWGVSSIRPNVIREYLNRANPFSFMMQYSLLDRRPEESCKALLDQHDTALLARGPIAKGLLAGKPARPYLDHSEEEVQKIQQLLEEASDPLTLALHFLKYDPIVTSAVVGVRTPQQLDDILKASDTAVSEDRIREVAALIPAHKYTKHR